ncbi:hypothetical protein ACF3NR_05450 [Vaginella massiliensis]|uniref:hypothetical protein n=1 Tax=Vaginella massiliensis TaxID=1816680 RepID=UPI0008384A6B|nr:hypothetical protein [Vaginella massiliensis]
MDQKPESIATEESLDLNKPNDAFDEKKIAVFWKDFLQQLKTEKRIPEYNVFETAKLSKVSDELIEIELSSGSAEAEFEVFRDRIVNGLKAFLNNYAFRIETKVSPSLASVNHIKSKKQIAQEMSDKNPALIKLIQDFGLNLFD